MKSTKKSVQNKKYRNFIAIVIFSILTIVAIVICVKVFAHDAVSVNPDDIVISENVIADLIETARKEVPTDMTQSETTVKVTEKSIIIGEHTYIYIPSMQSFTKGQEIPVLKKRIPSNLRLLFNQSRIFVQKFVQQYFDETTSEQIVKKMESTKFVMGDFTISSVTAEASFIYEDKKIYMNPKILEIIDYLPDELLVFTLVHEWVHMIRDLTYEKDSSAFLYGRLSEAMTDIIAYAIYPYNREDSGSYSDSYYYAYAIVSQFKNEAIQWYFYGQMLPIEEQYLAAFAFITQVMQDTVRQDGISDKEAYLTITQLSESVIMEDAIQLIRQH